MTKNKKKRKSTAQHSANPPPAQRAPMDAIDGRRQISYEDLLTDPTPPVPRHMVSYASSNDGEDGDPSTKAQAPRHETLSAEKRHKILSRQSDGTYDVSRAQPRTDPTYGQVGAFPGLDTFQYAPFYGPANDGLDYLRMVRSEARNFPHVMHAKDRKPGFTAQSYEEQPDDDEEKATAAEAQMREDDYAAYGGDDDDDYNEEQDSGDGYYSDGAYVAKPLPSAMAQNQNSTMAPQEAYYQRLRQIFSVHRAVCQASPPADAVAALDERHPISFPYGSWIATNEWRNLLVDTTPHPAQLCSMDRWTVWRLLRLCERHIRSFALHVENIPKNLTNWIWGLLGRLEQSWQMQNEEISKVRELGKCATYCLARYRSSNASRTVERGPVNHEGERWDFNEDDDSGERVAMVDAVKREQDAGGEPNMRNEGEKHSLSDVPQLDDNAEQGEVPTSNAPDRDLSEVFAAVKWQLQEANECLIDPPTIEGGREPYSAKAALQDEEAAENPVEREEVPSTETTAVLDLIVTVAGEFYGQRDLLWSRQEWPSGVCK